MKVIHLPETCIKPPSTHIITPRNAMLNSPRGGTYENKPPPAPEKLPHILNWIVRVYSYAGWGKATFHFCGYQISRKVIQVFLINEIFILSFWENKKTNFHSEKQRRRQ